MSEAAATATKEAEAPPAPAEAAAPATSATAGEATTPTPAPAAEAKAPPKNWWEREAPKATSVLALGKDPLLQKVKEICEALKLPFQEAQISAEPMSPEIAGDAGRTWIAVAVEGKDPLMDFLAEKRRTPLCQDRRLIIILPQKNPAFIRKAFALAPSGLWVPPHSPDSLAALFLTSRRLGG